MTIPNHRLTPDRHRQALALGLELVAPGHHSQVAPFICYDSFIGEGSPPHRKPTMTRAVISQAAVRHYAKLLPSEFNVCCYQMAGKIAIEGCRHGRLCLAHAMHAAAVKNAGPIDSDCDYHREWRHDCLPLAERVVVIAEEASRTT